VREAEPLKAAQALAEQWKASPDPVRFFGEQLSAALEGAAKHTCKRGHATEGNCRQCAREDENARSKALDDANGR
jgi:hypothetical protein